MRLVQQEGLRLAAKETACMIRSEGDPAMPSVETLRTLVRDEIIQRGEEGADTAGFKERWQEAR